MPRMHIISAGAACLFFAASAAEAGDGRWNAVQGWMKKLPPDASTSQTVQHGEGNGSSTVQLGGGNVSVIYQNGSDNNAQAVQTGRGNVSSIVQLGNANTATAEQTGTGNISSSVQLGDGYVLQRRQSGGELASSVQAGAPGPKERKRLERRLEKTAWRSVKQVIKGSR